MEFMGYNIDTANDLGVEFFGENWCLQDVLDHLNMCWHIAYEEAKDGQGASSKNIAIEHKMYVLREFCMMIDKESGLSTDWYDENLLEQEKVNDLIDDIFMQHFEEQEALLQEMRISSYGAVA